MGTLVLMGLIASLCLTVILGTYSYRLMSSQYSRCLSLTSLAMCLFYSFHFHFEMWDLLLLSCSSGILDLKLERLLYDGFIYLINGLWCCLGNAGIFERETPSNWQTKVQQLGLMKQRNEGQLILPSVAFPVAMTAGEVYLKIPDSESLFVLSPAWVFESVPTV